MSPLEILGLITIAYVSIGVGFLTLGLVLQAFALSQGRDRLYDDTIDYLTPLISWPILVIGLIFGVDSDERS